MKHKGHPDLLYFAMLAITAAAIGYAISGSSNEGNRITLSVARFIPVLIVGFPLLTISTLILLLAPLNSAFFVIFLLAAIVNPVFWVVAIGRIRRKIGTRRS